MPFATTQKDLEIIIPSEVNQRKTNITYTSYMWNLKKKKMAQMNLIYKTDTDSQPQKTNVRLPEGEGINQKYGINKYMLLYIKETTRTYCIAQGTIFSIL